MIGKDKVLRLAVAIRLATLLVVLFCVHGASSHVFL